MRFPVVLPTKTSLNLPIWEANTVTVLPCLIIQNPLLSVGSYCIILFFTGHCFFVADVLTFMCPAIYLLIRLFSSYSYSLIIISVIMTFVWCAFSWFIAAGSEWFCVSVLSPEECVSIFCSIWKDSVSILIAYAMHCLDFTDGFLA